MKRKRVEIINVGGEKHALVNNELVFSTALNLQQLTTNGETQELEDAVVIRVNESLTKIVVSDGMHVLDVSTLQYNREAQGTCGDVGQAIQDEIERMREVYLAACENALSFMSYNDLVKESMVLGVGDDEILGMEDV